MEGEEVHLNQTWRVGARIGEGGYGQVYEATSDARHCAVAKFVPKEPGADRELLFGSIEGARNVVPLIDQGEHADCWVLVMPRATISLLDHLTNDGPALALDECLKVLNDVAETLADLDGRVVHRDLKPENILRLDGHWCLADFGISRYAEASTAPDTRKYSMSPPYAAPERWRSEHARIACDVYALGILAYEMITGSRPFQGTTEQLREMHLHEAPPSLAGVPITLSTLVDECLYKAPDARPRPANVLARLGAMPAAARQSEGLAALREANHEEVQRRAQSAQHESAAQSAFDRRRDLFDAAKASFARLSDHLRVAIETAATSVGYVPHRDGRGWTLSLNGASLSVTTPRSWGETHWESGPVPVFDVVAAAEVDIKQPPDFTGYQGRSHSLWYADAQIEGSYAWFETAFMISPLIAKRAAQDPFSRDPGSDAAVALAPMMAEYQVAWPFTPLTMDDLGEFIGRWAGWFAAAATTRLSIPTHMPERTADGTWRR